MTSTPRVSIGFPVFNGAPYLRGKFASIEAQTFSDFEIVLCDNASNDGTTELLHEFAARDRRARYVRQPSTVDPSENFLRAFRECRAPYFTWTAADDIWDPDYLATVVRLLDENPQAPCAFTYFDWIDDAGKVVNNIPMDWRQIWSRSKFAQLWWVVKADLLDQLDPGPCRWAAATIHFYGLMRREMLERVDEYYRWPLESGSDGAAVMSILCNGDIVMSPRRLFHYRRNARRIVPRPTGAGLGYFWQRAVGATPGHRSNLLTGLQRSHVRHRAVRSVIQRAPVAPRQRRALQVLDVMAEAATLLVNMPRSILREVVPSRK
jgi:glycosyltransferase involved in cell wall biosynthesis